MMDFFDWRIAITTLLIRNRKLMDLTV